MKTTLITGTSKGMGKKIANFLLEKNHKIISISRSELNFEHKNLIHLQKDITKLDTINDINKILEKENIDNCILNAGMYKNSFFHKMSYNDWHDVINLNILSIYNILHPVINQMRKNKKGNIIFTSSVVGNIGSMGASSYACSKSSINGLVKSLMLENSNKNLLINSISPGYINEGMGCEIKSNLKNEIIKNIPLGKFGEVDELNELIYYLIEKNKYITGTSIPINGGMY